jgi:hypothetical protein
MVVDTPPPGWLGRAFDLGGGGGGGGGGTYTGNPRPSLAQIWIAEPGVATSVAPW